jgi:lipopolysaccharide/colanic/teichoic acid biosynthesis glycosyltransferase
MVKRLFDILVATFGLVLAIPVIAFGAIGIRLTSPGPVFYPAVRIGQLGREFKMYKLRSMHVATGQCSAITADHDPRVFAFGRLLRALKIDELPQLWNVLIGQMSIVGPRPEDPKIVADHYTQIDQATLMVKPGLTSPGSIYNYTHGETMIDSTDPERSYVDHLLPVKLSLEQAYLRDASLLYDVRLILRTVWVLACKAVGIRRFADPPEMRVVLADSAGTRRLAIRT